MLSPYLKFLVIFRLIIKSCRSTIPTCFCCHL